MKLFIIVVLFFYSVTSYAETTENLGFFIKTEFNDDDYINGFGSEVWLTNKTSDFGVAVNTSIGNAKVTDMFNVKHSYLAWDLGFKFGYFSEVFIYGEVGFDLGELILRDRDEDDYDEDISFRDFFGGLTLDDYYDEYDRSNDIDGYLGAGIGVKFDTVTFEAYSRYRQIDGEYWKANNQVFNGIKLTLLF
jgi:hypothetical protein